MSRLTTLISLVAACAFTHTAVAAGDPTAGKTLAEQRCQACHGVDGNSSDPQYPRLAGQHADYLAKALADYKSGARKNPIMSGFAAALSEQERENVAAWYASQTGLITPAAPRRAGE